MKDLHLFARSAGASLACIVLMSFSVSTSAGDLYRYRNDEGNLVINHTVPPRFAKNGYERMDSSGRVVERIEPAVEKPETIGEETAAPQAQITQERHDKYLLTSFSSVAEISAAEKRKLAQLSREIEILKSNSNKIEQLYSDIEREAAQFQRSGKDVSEAVMSRLTSAKEQATRNAALLDAREAEHTETKVVYGQHAVRFRELKDLPPTADPVADKTSPETPPATEPSSSRLASD